MKMKTEKKVIYISGVCSITHLLYVSSYIFYSYKNKNDYVILVEKYNGFLNRKDIPDEETEKWLGKAYFVSKKLDIKEFYRIPGVSKKSEVEHIYIGSVGIKPFIVTKFKLFRHDIKNTVIDEGLSFGSGFISKISSLRRERSINLVHALMVSFIEVTFKRKLLVDKKWQLYSNYKINPVMAEFIKAKNVPFKYGDEYILFLSQPWVELGVMKESKYLELLRNIKMTLESHCLKLLIKPHPSELLNRYTDNCYDIYKDDSPIELSFDSINCIGLVGFNSTGLINISALYSVPIFRLHTEEMSSLNLSLKQEHILNEFSGPSRNINELACWVKRIRNGTN